MSWSLFRHLIRCRRDPFPGQSADEGDGDIREVRRVLCYPDVAVVRVLLGGSVFGGQDGEYGDRCVLWEVVCRGTQDSEERDLRDDERQGMCGY